MLGGPRCLEAPEALNDVEAFFKLVDSWWPAATSVPKRWLHRPPNFMRRPIRRGMPCR
jgi:hypothetical protein